MDRRSPSTAWAALLLALAFAGCEGAERQPPSEGAPRTGELWARDSTLMLSITNGIIAVSLHLPDPLEGYYRGTRFDWSGLVSRVDWEGHTLFSPWKDGHDPANHDDVHGNAEEFGMETPLGPLGYTEAGAGETFVKIGVGVLEKPKDAPYRFAGQYRIVRPGTWEIARGRTWAEFRQDLAGDRGWSYRYVKRVELDGGAPAFRVIHTLRNTGDKAIECSHYCHNFINFDGRPIGPGVKIRLPWGIRTTKFQASGAAEIRGREIVFTREAGSFWAMLAEVGPENRFEVEDPEAGYGVRVSGDLPPFKMNIWGQRRVISPEPFVALRIPPGGSQIWTLRYELYRVGR